MSISRLRYIMKTSQRILHPLKNTGPQATQDFRNCFLQKIVSNVRFKNKKIEMNGFETPSNHFLFKMQQFERNTNIVLWIFIVYQLQCWYFDTHNSSRHLCTTRNHKSKEKTFKAYSEYHFRIKRKKDMKLKRANWILDCATCQTADFLKKRSSLVFHIITWMLSISTNFLVIA